jgi:tetratricopeptide (TPR) repeat protein
LKSKTVQHDLKAKRDSFPFAPQIAIFFPLLVATVLFAAAPPQASNSVTSLLNAGRVDEVIAALKGKDDAASHNLLARAYYAEDKTDDAIHEAEKSVEMAPNNAEFHLWLGRAYGQKAEKSNVFKQAGLAGKVRGEFEKAVQLDPNNVDARSDLAEYYTEAPGMMGGGVDKAKAQADAVAQRDPAAAAFIRAKIAEKKKDDTEAVKEFKAAIAASKTPADHWLNLAAYYRDHKNTAEMMEALKKAISSPRKSGAVLHDAAHMLYETGQDLVLAADLARKYLVAPDKSEEVPTFKTHVLLGKILEKRGDKAGSEKEFAAAKQMAHDYNWK